MHPFHEDNDKCQRVFIESLAWINGIYLDLTNISKMDIIVVCHNSVNVDYTKLKKIIIN